MQLAGKIFLTGGTGSLGTALLQRAEREGWECRFTVFSRDEVKQGEMRGKYPKHRFVLGNVTDRDWLTLQMANHDMVIHAAAYKQVPAAEVNASEAIRANVLGSLNIAFAAVQNGIPRVIGISTDKACLDYHSRVRLADGSTASIASIVKERRSVDVQTMTRHGLSTSKVTGWYKNKRAARRMFNVSYKHAFCNGGLQTRVLVTEDHPILTAEGWKQAQFLVPGEPVITAEMAPNDQQMALLIGGILGDSCAKAQGNGRGRMAFGHAADQQEWVRVKHAALSGLHPWPVRITKARPGKQSFYRFNLHNSGYLAKLSHQVMAEDGTKIVPRALVGQHFCPLMLATWYLDDGCKSDKNARLAVCDYSRDDAQWLADLLTSKGISAYVYEAHVGGKPYFDIRLTVPGSNRLFELIGPYVPPTMRHKVPPWAQPYDPSLWELGPAVPFVDEVVVREVEGNHRDVYCLDVEGSHNFVVAGVVVHNCAPVNLYGETKACMEKMFQQACMWGGTQFNLCRYGNVLGSRGSVLPLFHRQVAEGKSITLTKGDMTRFWLTLDEAVDLVLRTAMEKDPGTIIVPEAPASTMFALAESVGGMGYPTREIGIRPGEKLHEHLIHGGESMHTMPVIGGNGWRGFRVFPAYTGVLGGLEAGYNYSSDIARHLSLDELRAMVKYATEAHA
jgi:nucleoside-diphosphate-sugar epimerase